MGTQSVEDQKLKFGLIGYGYWGKNLLRNLLSHPQIQVQGVVDQSEEQRQKLHQSHPQVRTYASSNDLLQFPLDAVVIATPPESHFEIANECLDKNIHLLIEKPVVHTSLHCSQLIRKAKEKDRIVMVDHTFVYHPAVKELTKRIHDNELGSLQYYDSIRVNFGGFQQANALWDLAPHDLSILDCFLKGQMPTRVSAWGVDHFSVDVENLVYVTLEYPNQFVAHMHLNRIAPVKLRQIMIGGDKKMVVYDDTIPSEKIKIYHQNIALNESNTSEKVKNSFSREFETKNNEKVRVSYRTGDMVAPAIPHEEALFSMISHFVECIESKSTPITDLESGHRVLRILEAAQLSMNQGGSVVRLDASEPKPGLPRSPEGVARASSGETEATTTNSANDSLTL